MASLLTMEPDPRVEGRVEDVDDRVEQHDEEGAEERDDEHRRNVELADRLGGVLPDSLEVEDGLGEDRAASHHRAEVEAPEGDTGIIELRRTCLTMHAPLAERPFARAVRT